MIIVGDIASPTVEMTEKLEKFLSDSTIFKNKNMICNLEGLLADNYTERDKTSILYNHISILENLKAIILK